MFSYSPCGPHFPPVHGSFNKNTCHLMLLFCMAFIQLLHLCFSSQPNKHFSKPVLSKSYSMFHVCSFLGKKKTVSMAQQSTSDSENSPTSHLRWANHQLSFLITLFGRWGCCRKIHGEMLEDKWKIPCLFDRCDLSVTNSFGRFAISWWTFGHLL